MDTCLPSSDWAAIAAIAALLTAISAIAAQFVESRHRRLGRKIDLVGRFESQFEAPNFLAIRQAAATFLLTKDPNDRKGEDAVYSILNFFESIGYFWTKKVLDDETVWTFMSFWMLRYSAAAKAQLNEAHAKDGDSYMYIEPMCEAMKRFKEKRNPMRNIEHLVSPAQIREFLQDESNLCDPLNLRTGAAAPS